MSPTQRTNEEFSGTLYTPKEELTVMKKVAEIKEGHGFGELALLAEKKRN